MEYLGIIALLLLLCYISYPGRVRKLERKVKKLGTRQSGGSAMSKLISQLIGKNCTLKTDENLDFSGSSELNCTILDADDEWIQCRCTDKKGNVTTRILRIDSIEQVLLPNEPPVQ